MATFGSAPASAMHTAPATPLGAERMLTAPMLAQPA
jgi:hypothetical protein